MSGVISFAGSDDSVWGAAGWVFRRLLADVKSLHVNDFAFAYIIDQAEALNGLHIALLAEENPLLATKVRDAISQVVSTSLRDDISANLQWKTGLDINSQRLYLDALRELARYMKSS